MLSTFDQSAAGLDDLLDRPIKLSSVQESEPDMVDTSFRPHPALVIALVEGDGVAPSRSPEEHHVVTLPELNLHAEHFGIELEGSVHVVHDELNVCQTFCLDHRRPPGPKTTLAIEYSLTNMTATQTPRRYRSPLREAGKEKTRAGIVEAAAKVLAAPPPELRISAVARAAGVGEATVYRHFTSREELLDAVYEHWMAGARRVLSAMPSSRDGYLDHLSDLWREQTADEGLERAMSIHSPAGRSVRRRRLARRREAAIRLVDDVDTGSPTSDRALHATVLLLTSTTAHRHLCDYWDMTTEEAAAIAAWAVRTLIIGTHLGRWHPSAPKPTRAFLRTPDSLRRGP